MDTLEEYEIYKAFKTNPGNVLNDRLSFKTKITFLVKTVRLSLFLEMHHRGPSLIPQRKWKFSKANWEKK